MERKLVKVVGNVCFVLVLTIAIGSLWFLVRPEMLPKEVISVPGFSVQGAASLVFGVSLLVILVGLWVERNLKWCRNNNGW